jgi:hypothetical protein
MSEACFMAASSDLQVAISTVCEPSQALACLSVRGYHSKGPVALPVVAGRDDVSRSVVIDAMELAWIVFSGLSSLVKEDVIYAGDTIRVRAALVYLSADEQGAGSAGGIGAVEGQLRSGAAFQEPWPGLWGFKTRPLLLSWLFTRLPRTR